MNNWIENAIFYQIYPLGFCGASRFHEETITHALPKIIEWIPHLKKLHITAVYLGPVFESYEHGYDTSDYRMVDHRLGDNNDLKKVCDALHEAGIQIVLDGVFNHVGRYFWAFLDVKEKREASKYCDWFEGLRFDCDNPMNDGFCYDTWQGYHNLVKLNLRNEEVITYLLDSISIWMEEYHIDGLRLDAADVMDRDFFRRLKTFCKQKSPTFWLMGEIIHGNYTVWANDEMLDSVTNYECYKGLYSSHNDHNYFEIAHSLNRQFQQGGIYEHLRLYNFVDNHDVNRLASAIVDKSDLNNIYTLLYTMPGIPSLYYGSEWALEGTRHDGSDADIRPCLDLQQLHDGELFQHLCKLGELREHLPLLYHGNYTPIQIKNEQFVFARQYNDEIVYIALNVNEKPQDIELQDIAGTALYDLLCDEHFIVQDHRACISIAAKSARILKVEYTINKKIDIPVPTTIVEELHPMDEVLDEKDVDCTKPTEQKVETTLILEPDNQAETMPLGRYEHYKGNHYTVLYIATHSETLEKYVVYRQLYGNESVWVRPYAMFNETVMVDGVSMKRFTYIAE